MANDTLNTYQNLVQAVDAVARVKADARDARAMFERVASLLTRIEGDLVVAEETLAQHYSASRP